MKYSDYETAKRTRIKWLVVMAIFTLATINLFSYNKGDYRTKWGGNFEDLSLWEYYNVQDGKATSCHLLLLPIPFINTQNIAIHPL
jgi:hypothetical protein